MQKSIVVLVLVAVAAWPDLDSRVSVESGDGSDPKGAAAHEAPPPGGSATSEVEIDADLGESRWPGEAAAIGSIARLIENPLYTRFWSMVPYRLGDDAHKQAIKFSAKPCVAHANDHIPSDADPSYLREAMVKTLAAGEACFDFLVQTRQSAAMKVEDSKTEWKESAAPFVKVATITIPRQAFASEPQMDFCEHLSFTPWHALPEHRPLGGVNRVRRVVYEQISRLRHDLNRVPRTEPTGDEAFPFAATPR